MIPRSFEYSAPRVLDEAVSLLQKLGPEAKILSGGQSLIPMMKLRLASPQHIIDINGIPNLNYLSETNGALRIGALTRESDLEFSSLIESRFPLLADTTKVIADPLVRNQATVCGNLAHGVRGEACSGGLRGSRERRPLVCEQLRVVPWRERQGRWSGGSRARPEGHRPCSSAS